MLKTFVGFWVRPSFQNFNWVNLTFYSTTLCLAAFLGSFASAFVVGGAAYASLHLLTGRLPWALPEPVKHVFFAFCGFFAADLIAALVHPSRIAFNEVLENLPFLGFAGIYSITFVDRRKLLHGVESVAAASSIFGALIILVMFSTQYRTELAAGNSNVLALLGGVLYVLNVGAAFRRRGYYRLIYVAAAVCATYLLMTTGTRAIWPVSVVIPLLGLLYLCSVRQFIFGLPLIVVVLGISIGVFSMYSKSFNERIEYAQIDIHNILIGDLSGSIGQRLEIYRAGYELFLEKPLLGYGPANERQEIAQKIKEIDGVGFAFSHAHNAALNAMLRSGILGLLALGAIVMVPFIVAFRAKRDETGQAGFFVLSGILLVYLCSGSVGLMLGHDIHDSVFISGLSYSLYLVFGRSKTHEPQSPSQLAIPRS